MRVLAIETSSAACSVALIDDGIVVDHGHAVVGRGHTERLLSMIAELAGGGRADAIVVDAGPGSFTGIRVGIAAARALGFAWGVPVTGFSSLALLSAADGGRDDTAIVIEGGHGQLFVARYAGTPLTEREPPRSLAFDDAVSADLPARMVGNAAGRLREARGHGTAVECEPDARMVALLPSGLVGAPARPFYGRAADAKPMA